MEYLLTAAELGSRDFLLNLWAELLGIIVTIAVISPLIYVISGWRQRRFERHERLQMIGHLDQTFSDIAAVVEKYTNTQSEEYVGAHLMQLYEEIGRYQPGGNLTGALGQLSETPAAILEYFVRDLRQRINFMDSLLLLFAPHLRTRDAYVAKEYIDSLHAMVHELQEARSRMDWVRGSVNALSKLTEKWPSGEPDDAPGADIRKDALNQMKTKIGEAVLAAGGSYKSIEELLKASNAHKGQVIESLGT